MKNPGGRPRKNIIVPDALLPKDQESFTVPEVSELTGIHVRTIQARLRDGTLAGKRLGGIWHIYRDSLVNAKVDVYLNNEKGVKK